MTDRIRACVGRPDPPGLARRARRPGSRSRGETRVRRAGRRLGPAAVRVCRRRFGRRRCPGGKRHARPPLRGLPAGARRSSSQNADADTDEGSQHNSGGDNKRHIHASTAPVPGRAPCRTGRRGAFYAARSSDRAGPPMRSCFSCLVPTTSPGLVAADGTVPIVGQVEPAVWAARHEDFAVKWASIGYLVQQAARRKVTARALRNRREPAARSDIGKVRVHRHRNSEHCSCRSTRFVVY